MVYAINLSLGFRKSVAHKHRTSLAIAAKHCLQAPCSTPSAQHLSLDVIIADGFGIIAEINYAAPINMV